MVELVKFKVEHLLEFSVLTREEIELVILKEKRKLIALTAMVDGKAIGCAGIARCHNKVYAAWASFSEEIRRYPKWLHKTAIAYLRAVRALPSVERIEVLVLAESCRNCRWIERLGFKYEGLAFKAGMNGEDCMRFFWIRSLDLPRDGEFIEP